MEKKCAICKKKFDVLYPDLWRYKRGDGGNIRAWFCTYGCMRKYDKRKEEGKMARPRKDGTPARKPQKKTEIEVTEKLPEPEKEWTPAEEVYTKEEQEKPTVKTTVELVYDPSIAEEYRREQEAKKAEDPLVYEIPIRKERVNIGPARLPIASVWSRAMEMGTFTKVQGIGMMLKDPECQILMSRAKWEELADEIRVALEMLEV